jgi:tetratricopeptide (TPR) repeat protein
LVRKLRHEEGVAELKKAEALDPFGPEAAFELARTMPPNAEAAALLEKAARERPTYGAALRRLAEVDMSLGRLPAARKAAEAAIKADASDAASHLVLGRVSFAEGDADGAIKEAQAALAIVANSASAKLLIADSYAKKGEVDLAVENYQTAYGLDHADPAPLVRASEACHVAGRETSAKAFGEKATKEFPEWAPAWIALGDALAANKDVAGARAAYETAARSKGPFDGAALLRKLAALK